VRDNRPSPQTLNYTLIFTAIPGRKSTRMNSRLLTLATLALLNAGTVRAQMMEAPAPDQIGLSLSTSATITGKGDLKNGSTIYQDLYATHFSMELRQSIQLDNAQRLGVGIDYDTTTLHKPEESSVPIPEDLKSLGASVSYFRVIDPKWMLSASFGAGSYVTDTGLLSEGWGTRASVIGLYNYSRQLTLAFGAAHNSLSEDFKFLPVVGLDWRPDPKWSVAVGFPRIAVNYRVDEQLKIGLGLTGTGGAYYVKNNPRSAPTTHPLADSRLQHLELRLGFNADWRINDNFRVSGSVGEVLLRRLKYINRDYELKSKGLAPYASVTAILSF